MSLPPREKRTIPYLAIGTRNIHGSTNQEDIGGFRLQDIALWRTLTAGWPVEELLKACIQKAEGLFIWVATVCDYLHLQLNPTKHPKLLVSECNARGLPAEAKMDNLYSSILSNCNWGGGDFVHGYH
jgi:hypothetical protein